MATDLDLAERLERIETLLHSLLDQRTIKEWYSTTTHAVGFTTQLAQWACR